MSFLHIKSDSTFEESIEYNQGTLPSITFCPIEPNKLHFQTLEDIVKALDGLKSKIVASIFFFDGRAVNLKNSTATNLYLNLSQDDLWNFGVTVRENSPYPFDPCATLNLGFIDKPNKQGDIKVSLIVFTNTPVMVEQHEPGQSSYHYRFDWLEGMESKEKKYGYQEYFISTVTTSLKKQGYECDEKNQMKKTECIDEFLTKQLNCSLPWMKKVNSLNCTGNLTILRELYYDLRHNQSNISPQVMEDLRKCLIPNCITTKWRKTHAAKWILKDKNGEDKKPERVSIHWILPSNAYTIKRREIFLANDSTFFADIGSYLGLFLGASILSLTDIMLTFCKNCLVKAYGYCKGTSINHVPKTPNP